jgi:hypothetical protein
MEHWGHGRRRSAGAAGTPTAGAAPHDATGTPTQGVAARAQLEIENPARRRCTAGCAAARSSARAWTTSTTTTSTSWSGARRRARTPARTRSTARCRTRLTRVARSTSGSSSARSCSASSARTTTGRGSCCTSATPNNPILPSSPAAPMRLNAFKAQLSTVGAWELHRFRHTCGTEWLRAGMELAIVSRLFGHSTSSRPLAARDRRRRAHRAAKRKTAHLTCGTPTPHQPAA